MKKHEKREDQRVVDPEDHAVDRRPKRAKETIATQKRAPKQSSARALDKLH